MSVCAPTPVPGASRSQKRVLDVLALELQMVVSQELNLSPLLEKQAFLMAEPSLLPECSFEKTSSVGISMRSISGPVSLVFPPH